MWRSQMMYMIPSRRVMADWVAYWAGADSQASTRSATARWAGVAVLTPKSKARPPLCSGTPAGAAQGRPLPRSGGAGDGDVDAKVEGPPLLVLGHAVGGVAGLSDAQVGRARERRQQQVAEADHAGLGSGIAGGLRLVGGKVLDGPAPTGAGRRVGRGR